MPLGVVSGKKVLSAHEFLVSEKKIRARNITHSYGLAADVRRCSG
jgi:hypothetical protein